MSGTPGSRTHNASRCLTSAAGHGGSHPHLAHEFVRAIVEDRESAVDARRAANRTMAGICSHESALKGGARVTVPTVR